MANDEYMYERGQEYAAQREDTVFVWGACRENLLEAIEEGDTAGISYYQGMFTQQPGVTQDEYGMQYTYDA